MEANFEPDDLLADVMSEVETELHRIGLDLRKKISAKLDEQGINFNQDLKKSLTHTLKQLKTAFRLQAGPTVRHAEWVYAGTDPHWPPYRPIRNWTRKKLNISPGETAQQQVRFWASGQTRTGFGRTVEFTAQVNRLEQATRAIMHKIATEGTEGQDFLSGPLQEMADDIPDRLEAATQRALNAE